MSWAVWTAAAMTLTSTEQVLHRRFLSRTPSHWEYLLGYNVGALVAIFALLQPSMTDAAVPALPLLILSGVLWFIACYFGFKADQRVEVSATSLVGQTQLVLVFLGGLFLFGEGISIGKVAGSALVVLGISLLGTSLRGACRRGVAFKLISASAAAGALLIDKRLTGLVDPKLIPAFGFFVPMLLAVAARPGRLASGARFAAELWGANVALGVVGALAYYSLIRAFAIQDVSTAFPMYQAYLLLTIFAGHYFLREGGRLQVKLAAAATVLLGAVCLSV